MQAGVRPDGRWSAAVDLPKAERLPVLVIDDNRAVISLFQRYLAGSRYRVVTAESGAEAVTLAAQVRPGVITLDIMLPAHVQALRPRTAALAILTAVERLPAGVHVIGARELLAIVEETMPGQAPKRPRLR
jgi:CheY-like chemotaxis protein